MQRFSYRTLCAHLLSQLMVLTLFAGAARLASAATFKDKNGSIINQVLLPHPDNPKKKIEVFWSRPDEPGPNPVMIYIHGHQGKERIGGRAFVNSGLVGRLSKAGYICAALSQPGYGGSDGPPDFCGPFSQNALAEMIKYFRSKPFVNKDRIMLYGDSRGAVLASMLATKDARLAGVILIGGIYDFRRGFPTGVYWFDDNVRFEAGVCTKDFSARSVMPRAERIKCPVLLMHGAEDDHFPAKLVKEFADKLSRAKVPVEVVICPETGHSIPQGKLVRTVSAFRRKYLWG